MNLKEREAFIMIYYVPMLNPEEGGAGQNDKRIIVPIYLTKDSYILLNCFLRYSCSIPKFYLIKVNVGMYSSN